ncbi:MAG: BrnT family toxin [Cyanobacteria bacterium P01_G01_bin.39]
MKLEWDENKRRSNLKKHGFDFLDARIVLQDNHLLKQTSYSNEERWLAIGLLEEIEVTIIYTKRQDKIRIISMRRARHEERRAYRQLYG